MKRLLLYFSLLLINSVNADVGLLMFDNPAGSVIALSDTPDNESNNVEFDSDDAIVSTLHELTSSPQYHYYSVLAVHLSEQTSTAYSIRAPPSLA
ncbi:hypothetical protein KIH87_11100 [Paraneptunicella aestuarii]|uniref:hypothetical protein n=1 Tax=Paraneptunicella aestuarii TaxID=2831148 RepID=UPI001E462D96|nr:hypothetical protein [Paraneptunicella aestuarii]UAA37284.1 hypothetical protein KIH87_11100 [Paraneptunicella aestuarii]